MEAGQSEWFRGEQEFKGRAGQLVARKSRCQRQRGREETGAGVMIHPEVDVIGSQSFCGPRVGRRKKERHAGLSMWASAFHTVSFSGYRRLELSVHSRLVEAFASWCGVRPMWVPQNWQMK